MTDPLGHQRVVTSNTTLQVMLSDTDALSRTATYQYDASGRLVLATQPEGDSVGYAYDARGNVTQTTSTPKPGSGLGAVSTTAGYDATCTNIKTCNQPNWTKDALSHQTDYTYDANHGGVLTVTAPAPTSGAVRPQTRYTYAQVASYAKNSGGTLVQAGLVWSPTGSSACIANASCAGAADETKTTVAYAGSNNGLPTSVTRASGDGALSATTSLTYDNVGNLLTVDAPMAGTADTTRYRYDAARQLVGVVGPDPDGAGPLKYRAMRASYDLDGRQTVGEQGTVNSQSDADWAAMTVLQQGLTKYDAIGRPTHKALNAGGAIQAVIQYSYDNANRLTCSTTRMNAAVFGAWPNFSSLPASACTLGTEGSDGPDRISYVTYDAADQVIEVIGGYGTLAARREVKNYYFSNGTKQYVVDGAGNTTQYVYDGFDRLKNTYYSVAAVGTGATNGSDFDLYSYDAANNVTQANHRGAVTNYTYDALNRLTYKDNTPGWYYYDNLNRPTYTYSGASAEKVIAHYYDGLGRPSTTYDYRGGTWYPTTTSYDLAGRLTQLQWQDGVYVNYDYDAAGEVTGIRENGGAFTLALYTYDDLGRRTATYRANSAQSVYAYDAASRLASLTLDLAGTAQDETYTYTYNVAGQIKARTSSNDAYLWTGGGTVNRPYAINGLNQVTAVGGVATAHDARGNLTGDGATNYSYDANNRLTGTSTGAALAYDPLGRLDQTTGATTTKFVYAGSSLIAELDAGNAILRRYVPGPGTDEPLVWYEGAGVTDRRFLLPDERGSIVAVTNGSGAATTINTYDEYGVPGAGNQGRYQYTGQTFVSELGVYNYKARMYSPTLGRFMQTDPIGYGDGMNWYAYVGNDPINSTDPAGLNDGGCGGPYGGWEYAAVGDNCPPTPVVWPSNGGGETGGSGGGSDTPAPNPPANNDPVVCPDTPRTNLSLSYGATVFLVLVGISPSAEVGVSFPTSAIFDGDFRGIQVYGSGNVALLGGLGLFAGAGPSGGFGSSPSAMTTGPSSTPVLQGGVGWGAGAEVSGTIGTWKGGLGDASQGFQGGGGGGPRGAYGGYVGVGSKYSWTLASPQIGCKAQ